MNTTNKIMVSRLLEDQEKLWKCAECQAGFARGSTRCASCGKGLNNQSYKFSFLQAMFLKLGVRL